ncbi:hypothetical protein GOODEAATRI_034047 [Goodea atripinnis]|uniref:Uncharacterized protein n=1 Tax=Goodea atripinnis TaxID=208336 RepID=A0ABV0NGB3_9TELE
MTISSDLEALILIPAASHSAANCSSESCRSRADETNRTTSSAKSRDAILRQPKRIPSTLWLHLEILSINVMNRISDKRQPWWSPTLTRNESDLLPAMRTKLRLWLYRDLTAHIKGPGYLTLTLTRGLTTEELFNDTQIGEPAPRSPGSASSVEDVPVGLRKSSKYSAHRPTTSRVEVSSTPSPL